MSKEECITEGRKSQFVLCGGQSGCRVELTDRGAPLIPMVEFNYFQGEAFHRWWSSANRNVRPFACGRTQLDESSSGRGPIEVEGLLEVEDLLDEGLLEAEDLLVKGLHEVDGLLVEGLLEVEELLDRGPPRGRGPSWSRALCEFLQNKERGLYLPDYILTPNISILWIKCIKHVYKSRRVNEPTSLL
ncbi:hypothetical protein LIER_11383 [Lithospermum erythrorhizon]|uniref:Uncharacterized protein n=1 Tax=Lithospermum erythrorhizon TaxID=34254 RepID=A0AAV3PMW7_LITER